MKKTSIILAVVLIFCAVAMLTNPSQDRHKEVLKTKLTAYMQKSMTQNLSKTKNEWGDAGEAFGLMFSGVMIDGIINNLVSSDNYVLFSTTKITWEGKAKIVGFGAFGNVFISDELDKAMNEGLANK